MVRPGIEILDRRLAELRSGDRNLRIRALIDLRHFPEHGDRVVPVLLKLLDDENLSTRSIALSVLAAYPEEAAAHVDRFLAILAGGEKRGPGERGTAAYLLARVAPKHEKVERALAAAVEAADAAHKPRFEYALRLYRKRTGAGGK